MEDLPLEKDFQRRVLTKLREIPGSYWFKINDRTTTGIPDLLGCVAGVFVAIELKTRSKVSAIQAYTLRKISDAHGQSFVATPSNFPEILSLLRKMALLAPTKPSA
jgi:hypothetical protein